MKTLYLLLFLGIISKSTAQVTLSPWKNTPTAAGFLKNVGQIKDQQSKAATFVYYQVNLNGQQAFITNYGLSILFANPKHAQKEPTLNTAKEISPRQSIPDSLTKITWELERTDVVLVNATILPVNITTVVNQESPGFNFYLEGSNANDRHQLQQHEVVIKDVYPGIDWRVYINKDHDKNENLKYDFIVHPGADISQIQLKYSDNAKIQIIGDEILIKTKMGNIREHKPVSYTQEDKLPIDVAYSLEKQAISFKTAKFDNSKTLVIDPSIFWMTYLTSSNLAVPSMNILGNDIETDAAGNIFVELTADGNVPFPTLNPGGGAYFQDFIVNSESSIIVMKFAPGGQLLWSTYFGDGVVGWKMSIDKFGNIVAIGRLSYGSPSNPYPNHFIPLLDNGGFYDAAQKNYFIAKFSNSGILQWCSNYANFGTYPTDMSYDINGNVYVVGWSTSYQFPVADPGAGAFMVNTPLHGSAQVLFISQFNAANQLTWSTRIEGNDYDPFARICTDKVGNIYLGGQLRSTNFPLVNAGGYFNNSAGDIITKFNPSRHLVWSTHFAGSFSFADLTTDDSCNLYVIASRYILKFDSSTNLIFQTSVNTPRMHFWDKINYDPIHDQVHLLGVMNDFEYDFPTINTACNGSFYNNGNSPNVYNSATDPIFAIINHDGSFSYRSLVDWGYEYYDESETAIDINGDPVYLFFDQRNASVVPNPQLTNPGNGAYFDNHCCPNAYRSALLLKLSSSELSVSTNLVLPTGCSCNGTATVSTQCGQLPFIYQWSNGMNTAFVSGLCPGSYWVRVTDANNLSEIHYFTIPNPPGSISSINTQVIPENCNRANGSINIASVQGGVLPYSYSLDGINFSPSAQFAALDSGRYIIRVKDGNGCVFNDTVVVSRIPGPSAIAYDIQKTSCIANDGELQVNAVTGGVGPYQYLLTGIGQNSTGLFPGLAATSYQLIVSDTAGCSLTNNIIIESETAAADAVINSTNDHCNQSIGTIQVSNIIGGTGPFSFSTDSIVFISGGFSNLAANSYYIFIRDFKGCVLKKGPVIIENENGADTVSLQVNHAYCGKQDGEITIASMQGGFSPYTFSIDGNNYSTSNTINDIHPGIHYLHVKDFFGCVYTKPFVVEYKQLARFDLTPGDTTLCYDEWINLNLSGDLSQVSNITWNIPAQGPSATFMANDNQKIIVIITDTNNCIIKDTSMVKVKPCNSPANCVLVPSVFTPNNDNQNDLIGPLANGCRITSLNFQVYDRWGNLVFKTTELSDRWNGNYKGLPQSTGAYAYICNYVAEDGIPRQKIGSIVLLR